MAKYYAIHSPESEIINEGFNIHIIQENKISNSILPSFMWVSHDFNYPCDLFIQQFSTTFWSGVAADGQSWKMEQVQVLVERNETRKFIQPHFDLKLFLINQYIDDDQHPFKGFHTFNLYHLWDTVQYHEKFWVRMELWSSVRTTSSRTLGNISFDWVKKESISVFESLALAELSNSSTEQTLNSNLKP